MQVTEFMEHGVFLSLTCPRGPRLNTPRQEEALSSNMVAHHYTKESTNCHGERKGTPSSRETLSSLELGCPTLASCLQVTKLLTLS